MFDQALLQAYQARLPQKGRRASDAEPIDDDVYASESDPEMEQDPQGLVDRLYRERLSAQPMRGMPRQDNSLPTTKRTY